MSETNSQKTDAYVLDLREEPVSREIISEALWGLKLAAAGVMLGIALGILAIEWL